MPSKTTHLFLVVCWLFQAQAAKYVGIDDEISLLQHTQRSHIAEPEVEPLAVRPRHAVEVIPNIFGESFLNRAAAMPHEAHFAVSQEEGRELAVHLWRLENGATSVKTYPSFALVVAGTTKFHDGDRQELVANEGDLVYFPPGSSITAKTHDTAVALLFSHGQISPHPTAEAHRISPASNSSRSAMMVFPQLLESIRQGVTPASPLLNPFGAHAFASILAGSTVSGKEIIAGGYVQTRGPAMYMKYHHDEFKLVLEGEFHLQDGTGSKHVAKKGDLIRFPRGANVSCVTPTVGAGLWVSPRSFTEPL